MVFADMMNLITLTVAVMMVGSVNFAKILTHATRTHAKETEHVESLVTMLMNVHVLQEESVLTVNK